MDVALGSTDDLEEGLAEGGKISSEDGTKDGVAVGIALGSTDCPKEGLAEGGKVG